MNSGLWDLMESVHDLGILRKVQFNNKTYNVTACVLVKYIKAVHLKLKHFFCTNHDLFGVNVSEAGNVLKVIQCFRLFGCKCTLAKHIKTVDESQACIYEVVHPKVKYVDHQKDIELVGPANENILISCNDVTENNNMLSGTVSSLDIAFSEGTSVSMDKTDDEEEE